MDDRVTATETGYAVFHAPTAIAHQSGFPPIPLITENDTLKPSSRGFFGSGVNVLSRACVYFPKELGIFSPSLL